MILKKKEIIAASLVVLIGLAGYLNWSYQDTIEVRDNESYVTTGKILGEAEMVSSNNEKTKAQADVEKTAYFEDAKANRESARAAAMETLKTTSQDTTIDEKTRALAGEKLVKSAENIEVENAIESILSAKGFNDICVYINEGKAIVTVRCDGLDEVKSKTICEAVMETAGIGMENIKIVEVK